MAELYSAHFLSLDRIWEVRNRTAIRITSAVLVILIALVDWWTKPYVSLGFLYLFPVMLGAIFLPRRVVALAGIVCAFLAEIFSSLDPSFTRFALEALALAGCGLFVEELVRNRRTILEGQDKLRALVETSPAAIVTTDQDGFIELANQTAFELMAPRNGQLTGAPIAAFLPDLHHALRWRGSRRNDAPQFRVSMQCQGYRGNDDTFTADVWFSTYGEGGAQKLAAIIAKVPEEANTVTHRSAPRETLNDRERSVLRFLVEGLANKEIAARMEISESTVKNTMQQLFAKTNVRTRAQLVRIAIELYPDDLAVALPSDPESRACHSSLRSQEPAKATMNAAARSLGY